MIDKLTPRILQTSKDNRAMGPNEMLDALNITVTGDEDGGAGVLKNIKGTNSVSVAHELAGFPDGENVVIGSVKDETLGVVYFFVWNENNDHSVFAYSSITNTYRLVLKTPELNFDRNGFVKGDVVRIKRMPEDKPVIKLGCTNPDALNYDPEAEFDDMSCVYADIFESELGVDPNAPPVLPALFDFCEYISPTDLENGILVSVAPFIGPLSQLLFANPDAVYTHPNTGNSVFYVSDILGNVYDFPLTASGNLSSSSYVLGENPAFGVNLPIETFGCSYTPPPPPEDFGDNLIENEDEGEDEDESTDGSYGFGIN
jgi:hypothetical protein|tara:strand:- start:17298 stop:18242 length:945 start_codon:yes stop_codon:yes gene_type:complete